MEAGRESRIRGEVAAGLRFRFQNAATGARYRRRRGARRAHCSCRDHGHRPAAGLEELTAAAHAWLLFAKHDHIRCVVNARASERLAIRPPLKLEIFSEVRSVN